MFSRDELRLLNYLEPDYNILISNGHDVRLESRKTGHEWIIISRYDSPECHILHRHSKRDPFHHQKGRYMSLSDAYNYIRKHDHWYAEREVDAET